MITLKRGGGAPLFFLEGRALIWKSKIYFKYFAISFSVMGTNLGDATVA
jgi:hypothetical protein